MTLPSNKAQSGSSNAVEMLDVTFSYAKSNKVLHCVDWSLKAQEQVFLHGSSGSGKSTLLSLLCGIAKPVAGRINIHDTCLHDLKSKQIDQFRAQNIGIVFQQFNLIGYLSVLQNIQLAAYFAKSSTAVLEKVLPMLESLKLDEDLLHKKVSQLSVGQKQRVAIMRALINSPELLLVDEPTSSLDMSARDGFMQMLLSLNEINKAAMIFVSHDQSLMSHFDQHVPIADICRWSNQAEATC